MNLARVRVNDTAFSIAGDLLSDDKPDTVTLLNAAYRWLQRKMANAGIETYIQEAFLTGLPAAASQDLVNQCFVSWTGCGDGLNQYTAPALPLDLILPLSVWFRQSGTLDTYTPMRQAENGLPTVLDHCVYDYRTDGLFFYGNTFLIDLRIRYSAVRSDLSLTVPAAQVPIMFCQDVLSARVAYEFCNKRGAAAAPVLEAMAEKAFDTMSMSTGRRKQRMSIRRMPYSGRGRLHAAPWPVGA